MSAANTTTVKPPFDPDEMVPKWAQEAIRNIVVITAQIAIKIEELGKLYVDCLKRDPRFYSWLIDATRGSQLTAHFWALVERSGRGDMDARLVLGDIAHTGRLRKLPITQQKLALDSKIKLLVAGGDHILVSIADCTPEQAEQVLAPDHIRTLEEQRAWLEAGGPKDARRATRLAPTAKVTVDRRRRRISVHEPLELTAKQLALYLQELTS